MCDFSELELAEYEAWLEAGRARSLVPRDRTARLLGLERRWAAPGPEPVAAAD